MKLLILSHPKGTTLNSSSCRPMGLLMQFIQQKNWDAARARVRTFPVEAQFRSKTERKTPLHVALINRAPQDVTNLLLEAYPNALFAQDSEGWSPVHVIILYGGHDVATTLKIIRLGGRIGGCLHSPYVGSPLHLACRHSCSREVLIELLKVSPNQVRVRNEAGMTPANLLWGWFVRHKSLKEPSDVQVLLEQLCLLLAASNGSTYLDRPVVPSFEQALAFQQRFAGETDFISLLLWFHPNIIRERRALPLHRASAYRPMRNRHNRSVPSAVLRSAAEPNDPLHHVLCRLDDRSLVAASASTDSLGRLPIHYAASTGKRAFGPGGELGKLISLNRDGLCRRDPVTGLYPFQLAARQEDNDDTPPTCSPVTHREPNHENDLETVQAVYQLLRELPQVMSCYASSPSTD